VTDAGEPFVEPELRAAVRAIRPGGTVEAIERIAAGKNAVYAVSLADREAVLKVGTAAPDRVAAEPAILRFVRARTGLPVPEPLGVSDGALDAPCCLLERVPGRTFPDRPRGLDPELLGRLCEEAGRILAALHDAAAFDAVGPLVPDGDGVAVDSGPSWPALLGRALEAKVDALDARFDDRRPALRAYAEAAPEAVAALAPFDPAPTHMDYRPANLVVAPEAPAATRAILDWGGAAAAPPAYELAHAEALLTAWPGVDADRRAALAERLRAGYGDPPSVPDAYRVDARLRLAKHLAVEVEDEEAALAARADDHRRALAELGAL